MTREEAIEQLKFMIEISPKEPPEGCDYIDEWWKGHEDMITAFEMAIEALKTLEDFERAQIITGGRLNGRTFAYKRGLEDGKRKALEQQPCEDSISRADALRVAKNEYLRGWHNALCKALSEKYSIHCEEGNFNVIQEETITGLGLSMDCAVGKDIESYMSTISSVIPTHKFGKWEYEPNCWLRCSCCGSHYPHTSFYEVKGSNYCPNCGAEMEGM